MLHLSGGKELSGYDTTIGFKTLQNDIIFGPHYIFSALFFCYLIFILIQNFAGQLSRLQTVTFLFISFLLPQINGFAPIVLLSIFGGFLITKHRFNITALLVDKISWLLLLCLIASYAGLKLLGVHASGLRSPEFDFEISVFFDLLTGLAINFFVLFWLFLGAKDKSEPIFALSVTAIIILSLMIVGINIEHDLDVSIFDL